MNKKFTLIKFSRLFFVLALCLITYSSYNSSSNPPTGLTGAPGEGNCTSCHSGTAVTSGTNWSGITLSGLPAAGYSPSTTYTLTLSGGAAATSKNGFSLTVLNSSNSMAGTLAAGTGSSVQVGSGKNYLNQSSTSLSSYTFSWTSPASPVGTITFYLSWNGTNGLNNTSGDVVYTKSFTLNQGGNPPVATITPSATTICLGDTLYLQGSATNNPTAWSWLFPGNVPSSSTLQNPKIVFNSSGVKQVRLTASNVYGNSSTVSVNITVVAKPTATISASTTTICGNDSVLLTANSGSNLSYQWLPNQLGSSQSIYAKDSGFYAVKVTNSSNCSATSSQLKVTKRNLPQRNFQISKEQFCETDTIVFSAVYTATGLSYQFYQDTTLLSNSAQTQISRSGLKSGLYKHRTFDGFCYSTFETKSLVAETLLPAPVVNCVQAESTKINFNWQPILGAVSYELSTDSGLTWLSISDTSFALEVGGISQTKFFQLKAIGNGLCKEGKTTKFNCSNSGCPKRILIVSVPDSICISPDSILTLRIPAVTSGPASVRIQAGQNVVWGVPANDLTVKVAPGKNTLLVSYFDSVSLACPIDTMLSVQVNAPFTSNLVFNYANQQKALCTYENDVVLSTNRPVQADSAWFSIYSQGFENRLSPSGNDSLIHLNLKGFTSWPFEVSASWKNLATGCELKSERGSFSRLPLNKAGFVVYYLTKRNPLGMEDTTTFPKLSRLWLFGDGNSDTSKRVLHEYPEDIYYDCRLILQDTNGCLDTAMRTVFGNPGAVNEIAGVGKIELFPNPTKDRLNLRIQSRTTGIVTFRILDAETREIEQSGRGVVSGVNEIAFDVSNLAKGIYYLDAVFDGNHSMIRFLVN